MPLFESVTDLQTGAAILLRRRFGVIEMADARLRAVRLRPWPKMISLPEALWLGRWVHGRLAGNRCWLYYDQPWGHGSFLAVKYVLSARDCTFGCLRAGMTVLEEIARLKGTDAALCDVTASPISDRLLRREGWQRHCEPSFRRHYIKRFYGDYPDPHAAWALC